MRDRSDPCLPGEENIEHHDHQIRDLVIFVEAI